MGMLDSRVLEPDIEFGAYPRDGGPGIAGSPHGHAMSSFGTAAIDRAVHHSEAALASYLKDLHTLLLGTRIPKLHSVYCFNAYPKNTELQTSTHCSTFFISANIIFISTLCISEPKFHIQNVSFYW